MDDTNIGNNDQQPPHSQTPPVAADAAADAPADVVVVVVADNNGGSPTETATAAEHCSPPAEDSPEQLMQPPPSDNSPPLSAASQHGGSNDSLNSTTETLILSDDASDSNREHQSAVTTTTAAAPALPPRTKTALTDKQREMRELEAAGLYFDQHVFIRPNGQTKLAGSRKSAASILMGPPTKSSTTTTGGDKVPLQQPMMQQQPQQTQRLLISTGSNVSGQPPSIPAPILGAANNTPANQTGGPLPGNVGQQQQQQPGQARVVMFCQPSSHPFQTRSIVLEPNQEVKVGRSITRNRVSDNNAIFDCKVLSRNHAQIWMSEGKFYIRDTASSNGTFVNDHRLSLTATSSKPYEVKSGDIVQFGVDVLENAYKEKHGCIVTLLRFCTGNGDDADDLTDPSAIAKLAHGGTNGSGNGGNAGGGAGTHSLSSVELYRLNAFIQEAMQREQLLETKLISLQKIVEMTRKNSANVWHSMIEEDHLLSRIDILENKLQYFQTNVTDDQLRTEVCKLQDDKSVYQTSAKEALRKVYQERNDAVMKLTTIERALCSSEDECGLLRNQLLKTQQSFKEVTVMLAHMEERTVDGQEHERQLADAHRQRDQQVGELCEQLKTKADEAHALERQLRSMEEQCEDLHARIETYAKMGERSGRAGGGGGGRRRRQRQQQQQQQRDSDGDEHVEDDDDDDDDDDVEEDEDDVEEEEEDDDDDDEDDDGLPEQNKSGSTTVNKWLDRLSAEAAKAKSVEKKETEQKKNKSQITNKQLLDRMESIDENLRTLDKLLSTLKHNRETTGDQMPPPSNTVQNDDNQNNDSDAPAKIDQPPLDCNESQLLVSITTQLRQVYADMLLNSAQQGAMTAKELDVLQAQLKASQQENADLASQEHRAAQKLHSLQQQSELDARSVAELQSKCDNLEQRLAEADAVMSLEAAVIDTGTDDEDDDDDDDSCSNINDNAAGANHEASAAAAVPDLATIAVQTEPLLPHENGADATSATTKTTATKLTTVDGPQSTPDDDGDSAVCVAQQQLHLSDFSDDIALLTDPAVQREEQLICYKEECARLKAHAQLIEQQLAEAQKQLATGGVGGVSAAGSTQPLMVYAALAVAVIGYILFSPYW